MIEILPFKQEHLKEALEIYNYYITNSTATFSIEPLGVEEFSRLTFTGLERFPSCSLLEDSKLIGY